MRHTTAFLVLLGCLTGTVMAQAQQSAAGQTSVGQKNEQPCTAPVQQPDPDAPQNQIEYGA